MLCVEGILTEAELNEVRIQIGRGRFVDGRWTAGGPAAKVKKNLILDAPDDKIDRLAAKALLRHPLFDAYASPWRFAPLQVAKYQPGMAYGPHIDAPLMGQSPRMRCDLSVTLFLNEPDEYSGGELAIAQQNAVIKKKLSAGSAVIYPADTLHWVEPIQQGERLVIVSWLQSHVQDHQIREMLYDLSLAIDRLSNNQCSPDALQRLVKTHANLYRKFAKA